MVKVFTLPMKSPVNNFLIGTGAEKHVNKMGFERRNITSKESMKKREERLKEEDSQLTSYDDHDTVRIIGLDTLGTMVAVNDNEDPTIFIASFKDNNLEFKKAILIGAIIIQNNISY